MHRPVPFVLSSALLSMAALVSCSALAAGSPSPAAPAAREIVLVRHGNYAPDASVDEKIGPPLSPIGVAQARLAGARLHGELSQLTRCTPVRCRGRATPPRRSARNFPDARSS